MGYCPMQAQDGGAIQLPANEPPDLPTMVSSHPDLPAMVDKRQMQCYSKTQTGTMIEVAQFISTLQDVFRHRRMQGKGKGAERLQHLKPYSWA